MNVIRARFAEIERNTGLSFSSYLHNSSQAVGNTNFSPEMARMLAEEAADGTGIGGTNRTASTSVVQTPDSKPMPASEYDPLFAEIAELYNLDPALIKAVAYAESSFRPTVVSSAGAMGLMQLMPATAEALGVKDPFDPRQNVDGGARYLAQLLNRFDGNTLLALAAYNCGSSRVTSRGITDLTVAAQRDLLPQETRNYLANIEKYLRGSDSIRVLDSPYAA
jgi:soluble lytic murein transglycosylase-like protein